MPMQLLQFSSCRYYYVTATTVLLLVMTVCCAVRVIISFSRHLNLHAPPIEDENDERLVDFLVDQGNTDVSRQTTDI